MRNRIVKAFIIIFLFVFITSVNAAKKDYMVDMDNEFTGTVTFDFDYPIKATYHPRNYGYAYHPIAFKNELQTMTGKGYCVYPGMAAASVNTVNCGIVSPSIFPYTYYIVYNYWDELKNDELLADFVLRAAGMNDVQSIDIDKIYRYCVSKCGGEGDAYRDCILPCQKDNEEAAHAGFDGGNSTQEAIYGSAFIASFQYYAYGDENAGQSPFLFIDNEGSTVVQRGSQILNEAYRAKDDTRGWVLPSNYGNKSQEGNMIYGEKFYISRSTMNQGEARVAYFDVGTIDGSTYDGITVRPTVSGAQATVIEWNGSSGLIKVVANSECKARIKIQAGTQTSTGGGSHTTPRNPSCPNAAPKKCFRQVPHYKVDSSRCYYIPCSKNEASDSCAPRTGRWNIYENGTPCNNIDSYKVIDYYINSPITSCVPSSFTCPSGSTLMPASMEGKTDVSLSTDYATEPDEIVLDDYITGEELEDSDMNKLVVTPQDRDDITLYYCQIKGQRAQSYVVVVDQQTAKDEFELDIDCNNCYVGDCTPAPKFEETHDSQIQNCCDGATSIIYQYALDELFCTDFRTAEGRIDHYKEKCNVKDTDYQYWTGGSDNKYCSMYCSNTVTYNIPGPTHAKSDMYFLFTRNKKSDGNYASFNGPQYEHYRRCRTLITYDVWNSDYISNVGRIIDKFNEYNETEARYETWKDTIDHPGLVNLSGGTINCVVKQNYEYEECGTCTYWTRSGDDHHYTSSTSCTGSSRNPYSCTSHTETCNCSYTGSGSFTFRSGASSDYSGFNNARYYNESTHKKTYKTYKQSNSYYYVLDNPSKELTGANILKWEESDVDAYLKGYDDAYSSAESGARSSSRTSESCSGRNCRNTGEPYVSCDSTRPTGASDISFSEKISGTGELNNRRGYANTKRSEYQAEVYSLQGLQSNLNQCSGNYNTSDGVPNAQGIIDRVTFKPEDEPELEFSYVQAFYDEKGKYVDQEIEVPFIKVGENGNKINQCISEVKTSIVDGRNGERPFPFWEQTGWQADNYYTGDGNVHVLPVGNYRSDVGYNSDIGNGMYNASRKYTTDAVGHMTCRWQDDPQNTTYNLVPNGLVVTVDYKSQGNLKDLGKNFSGRTGTYYVAKTTARGKYEVYYTLKNIGGRSKRTNNGLFDDLVHQEGKTCSGYASTNFNGTPVNLSCYIEVQGSILSMYDCSEQKDVVCGKDDTNCPSQCNQDKKEIALDYKEVDPADPFPYYDNYKNNGNKGYAFNWKNENDENAKAVLKHITETAQNDKTYSKEELTYSFTFTPKQLNLIRAYNKSRIKDGGYNDFNMKCKNDGGRVYNGTEEAKPLDHCTSYFLDAISGERPYNKDGVNLYFNAANVPIKTAREKTKLQ